MAAESKNRTLSEGEARALKEAERAHAAFLKDPKANEPVSVRQAELLRKHGKWDFGQASGTPDNGSQAGEPDPFAENAAQPVGRLELDGEPGEAGEEDGPEGEPPDGAKTGASPDADPEYHGGFDAIPRWLHYSGLSRSLTPAQWHVFCALVIIDHQTRQISGRRRGPDAAWFSAPQEDLGQRTGYGRTAITAALKGLAATKLLAHYEPRQGRGRWAQFGINLQTIRDLCAYVAPRLRGIHGGIAGVTLAELREGFAVYYGNAKKPENRIIASWETMYAWQKAGPEGNDPKAFEHLDNRRIAEICGLPAGENPRAAGVSESRGRRKAASGSRIG